MTTGEMFGRVGVYGECEFADLGILTISLLKSLGAFF